MKPLNPQFRQRITNPGLQAGLTDWPHVLRRVFSARGIDNPRQTHYSLQSMLPPSEIKHLQRTAELLATHLQQQSRILIFGDYDCDGATSTALCVRGLSHLGHTQVNFLLPDRVQDGYGVSRGVAQRIIAMQPDLVITVDSGISSFEGLQHLHDAGISVIVTDHHLPAQHLPMATAIINPNAFTESAGKNLAGVGVAFYLMLALRSELRQRGWFDSHPEPNMADLLDLVAIGTVADLVPLDYNNRILVAEGLKRIRAGACSAGIRALIDCSGRSRELLSSEDIAFSLAPRINAAGRLDDMSIGVQTLLTEDAHAARHLARELDDINHYRRELQARMTEQAESMLPELASLEGDSEQRYSYILYQPGWHEGIVGILASRIKDMTFRPAISFAPAENDLLKGSCRSIPGIHIRDMLDLVDKTHPGVIRRFGGHAMAAGLTIDKAQFEPFSQHFEQVLRDYVDPACFDSVIEHDGEIDADDFSLQLALQLREAGPWGQRFPSPSFIGEFKVLDQRVVGERHLKFVLSPMPQGEAIDAILFYASDPQLNSSYKRLHIHYELSVNVFRERQTLQLMIRHLIDDESSVRSAS